MNKRVFNALRKLAAAEVSDNKREDVAAGKQDKADQEKQKTSLSRSDVDGKKEADNKRRNESKKPLFTLGWSPAATAGAAVLGLGGLSWLLSRKLSKSPIIPEPLKNAYHELLNNDQHNE